MASQPNVSIANQPQPFPFVDWSSDSSTDTEAERERLAQEEADRLAALTPQPIKLEFTDEDMFKLVRFVKNMTTLYDLRDSDWTNECENIIADWFRSPWNPALSVFFDNDVLTAMIGFPKVPVIDLTYFLREANAELNVENFHEDVTFGTINENVEGSLLKVLENVYAPYFFSVTSWPDTVKSEFCTSLHTFLAKLTELHYKMLGMTVIYVPYEGLNMGIVEAAENKELVKRLDSVVVFWTRQLRLCLGDQGDQTSLHEHLGPADEYDFWVARYENLCGINFQLQNKNLQHIRDILLAAESTYIKQFLTLADDIDVCMDEAKSSIEFLQILREPCDILESTEHPDQIPGQIPNLLHLFRVIWVNSPYYNTPERITVLCVGLSNQVIRRCTEFADLDKMFAGNTQASIKMFNCIIRCCENYKQIYYDISKAHNDANPEVPDTWTLDNVSIFNNLDSFIQRCHDMVEVCYGMIHFGRYDELEEIPKPQFGGTRGRSFEKICEKIERMYREALANIEAVKSNILDVQVSTWYEDIMAYRTTIKELEVIIENLVTDSFLNVTTMEEALETLCVLFNYTRRPNLKSLFDRKTSQVWEMFADEIQDIKRDLTQEKESYPQMLPYFAGRAIVANQKSLRLKYLKTLLDDAGWMWLCPLAYEVELQYEKLQASIGDRVKDLFCKFIDNFGGDVAAKLDRPLMNRSPSRPGLIECNIDRTLLDICNEARYWENLGFEIPGYIKNVYMRYETIKFVFESVMAVVIDYNRILSSLSDRERLLFKQLINTCEKKIMPGLHKLTWNSEVSDQYIADCVLHTAQLQSFLDDYKKSNLEIVAICERICDTPIIAITPNYAFELNELKTQIQDYKHKTIIEILIMFRDIMNYLIVVYEGFEESLHLMVENWVEYVRKFDFLVEEALKICVKNSMHVVYEALHGDGAVGPSPLLKLKLILKENRIGFTPTLLDVASLISNALTSIIDSIHLIPRLFDKFHIPNNEGMLKFYQVIENDEECARLQGLLENEVSINIQKIQEYIQIWEPFRDLWEIDKDLFINRYEKLKPSAATFDANIGRYSEVANNVQMIDTDTVVHFITINAGPLKKSIVEHCSIWQVKLAALLLKMTSEKIDHIYEYTKVNAAAVRTEPKNLEQLGKLIKIHAKLEDELAIEESEFPSIEEQIRVLDKYEVVVNPVMRSSYTGIRGRWDWYTGILEDARVMIERCKDMFRLGLMDDAEKFKDNSAKLYESFNANGPFTPDVHVDQALKYLKATRKKLKAMRKREEIIKRDLGVFNISQPESEELIKLEKDLAALEMVWELTAQWDKAWDGYKNGNFWTIETDEMENTATTLFRKLTRLAKELQSKGWDIVEHSRMKVDGFRRTLPLLLDLKNPCMRSRHWDRVRKVMDKDFDEQSENFKLEAIINMNFQAHAEEINEISNAATMELQIEQGLATVKEVWSWMAVEMVPHKDQGIYRLKSVDDCFAAIEEHAVIISAMKATRYVEPFAKEVDYWERTLSYIGETLEATLNVQRQWLYLENIFNGEDIRKQLPRETTTFDNITEQWKFITHTMYEGGTAFNATHYEPPPYLLDTLNAMNESLEELQRLLEKYLETKRYIFPRFYFISNDDLLEILGNSKKPEAVQRHYKKLFDNLNKVKLAKHGGKYEVHGMFSDDGEYVEFVTPLVLEGAVERWLGDIETSMRVAVKAQLKLTRADLRKNLNKRDKWLVIWPGQLVITASQIQWTTDCTRTLMICKLLGEKKPLKKQRKKQNQFLNKLSEMSRKDLSKIVRLKVNALITIEIHAREVIDKMYKVGCMDISNFEWFSQLRFYWEREKEVCHIKQTNTHNWYGYEYLGNSGRLVITPLTDRCYITLTTALHLFRGGSPKGPAGTGKTETVKDLGKALGFWVIVTNCSEGLDFKSMGKCFAGLAQTGAWGCFDEFNRINIEVLSVVAQQILSLLSALIQGWTRFVFEGALINLKPTVGLFITMNPGYAGRTELPDNLKSMFRPISMMVPDSIIIADNILFSDGFQTSKNLARKVFTLYELAMQQLSKQDHYDFGLRSMVALLRYGGRKKRAYPDYPEDEIMYLAMKDMNIAKLTADDLPLFNGIVSDIFPGVTIPIVDYEEFLTCIEDDLKENGLQVIDTAVTKVLQLFETKTSRHSVIILGNTGTAKTVTWKTLKGALGRMKQLEKPGFHSVVEYPINPKALSLGELYGEYNLATNEWLDGVLSAIMRKTCADESHEQKWILFDGPVDAVWIENMNSVMDDNKLLTLINSERITMPEQVSLLFEVGDLSVASPATVSRCGMVYNDYKDWGWKPFINSWLKRQKDQKHYVPEVKYYIFHYLDKMLEFKRLKCEETCITSELNIVASLCKLLDCLATKENGLDMSDMDNFQAMVKLWFMFCSIWSVGATVNEQGRIKMDTCFRELESVFPVKDTVYEYYVDVKLKCFMSWEEKLVDGWRYASGIPFYKIIVPTVDTVRYEFIVGKLLFATHPVMLVGPVGTGKTSAAQAVTDTLDRFRYSLLVINMSAQTSSSNVQDILDSRIEKRTKSMFVPVGGKTMIVFMDDFNMPAKETYGSQPALELIRQWIDYGFYYDRHKQTRKNITGMLLMAAMGPPGGGRNVISSRLLSKFNVINMTFPANSQISRIFGTMISQQLTDFDEEVKPVGKIITAATIDLYERVIAKMLPTPAKMHYLFNLRDISKIFQGLLRSNVDNQNTRSSLLLLWIHECFRVFDDRLIDDKDQEWFKDTMNKVLGIHFDLTLHSLCPDWVCPVFGDFINAFGLYEVIDDFDKLKAYVLNQIEEYNASPGVVHVDLVLFKDAMAHIARIQRVISQPRGNMLLVGVGGSGRQSLTRVAGYMSELVTFQIEIAKNYGEVEFREDLKKLYIQTGVDNKATSFLFNDTQVTVESMLEIINNMLSTGEVSNLFKPDEFEEIKTNLTNAAKKAGVMPTSEEIYSFLIERVRSKLHIILCMSPIGDGFRNRLRQYPSLVNCTTIDWFRDWPKEALLEVANKYLSDIDFVATITGEKAVEVLPVENRQAEQRHSIILEPQERLRQSVASIFATVHSSVAQCSARMLMEMKRHNYVTPTNYLELVAGYKDMLDEKRAATSSSANKLRNGLWKIDDTRSKVETMSVELEVATVKVEECQKQSDEYLVIIVAQTEEADEQKKEVATKKVKIGEEETVAKEMAAVAQADLDEAMPALEEAMAALDSLNKADMTEIKSYGKPPQKVEMVLEAVMILKQSEPSWAEAKKQLGDSKFLEDLRNFDKDHISDRTLRKIGTYTSNPDFVPEKVGIVSFAAKSLCMWVRAIEKYGYIYKVVGPKIVKVNEVTASLRQKQAMLAEAQSKLDELNAVLEKLNAEYQEMLATKEALRLEAENLAKKLERAGMLVDGLAGEKVRWEVTVETLDGVFDKLPGDCVIATAFVSYLGPFVSDYREYLSNVWIEDVVNEEVPFSENFSISDFLCDPTTIREWNIQGLPSDDFSTENGIIVVRGTRWPLIIDPQCQAQKWIRNMEFKKDLKVIDFGQKDYMKTLEVSVQLGRSVLLQNVLETLEPSLESILKKTFIKQAGRTMIKLNDKIIEYNMNFRFFITTKLSNPHYSPEICTKTTLVNFAVKEQGLEAQLLGIVVKKERPQLEEVKSNLVLTIARNKRMLIDLENDILRMLNESRGSLLDDEELFTTLQTSKQASIDVIESLGISETTEVEIDVAREGYRPCSKRASILFFVLMDMSNIDPMYQFSLDAYILLFDGSIEKSIKNANLIERITILNDYHTYAVYQNTCRGLFEMHKLLFSFHMCMKILESGGKVNKIEYGFLLKGGVVLDRENQMDNPCKEWLSEVAWDNMTEMDKLHGFHGVVNSFETSGKSWNDWYINTEPENLPLIGDWDHLCNEFQKMLFVRCLRSDRMSICVSRYIVAQLGSKFVEPPVLDIRAVFEESAPQTPLIFVLSPGVDPTTGLLALAEWYDIGPKFQSLSLGQGQAPIATRMIASGAREGNWVFLANCHLSLSWMPRLDKIVETLQTGRTHPDFRLWLSSSPNPDFPISILQAGIKMTTEPPKGIKANLKRLYQNLSEEQFELCKTRDKYRKLLFALCFFHAVLLERKKFKELGWNVIYSFNDSDFEVSENLLGIYLDEYTEETPWDALKYLIAGVNYGGHVTDDWDRRLMTTYINQYFCEEAIREPHFKLSSLAAYYIPKNGNLDSYREFTTVLPTVDRPEAFGQHTNADITSLITETRNMFETLMSIQAQISTGTGGSKEDKVAQLAQDVQSKVPEPIDYENTNKLIGEHKTPLDVVLLQEIQRYNILLLAITTSLEELQKGINGFVVMSSELDEIFTCIYEGRVPSAWLKAYPSLKQLGSWTRDLVLRIEHFAVWAETTHPPILFWLAAYTFPTGFLTAVLQTAARTTNTPIDMLSWDFTVWIAEENTAVRPPEDGVYIRGTFLEGAGWHRKNQCLEEPLPMQLVTTMPIIHFKPVEQLRKRTKGFYMCPAYYYPCRTGAPGRPAYVVTVDLKSGDANSDHWVKRATALLLSLDI